MIVNYWVAEQPPGNKLDYLVLIHYAVERCDYPHLVYANKLGEVG